MVVALGPGKFYGSSLPRPRFYTDVKFNDERVDPPPSVIDPFMSWAQEAHWSMGGLSFKRQRLQGRIEGNVERLRAQQEQTFNKSPTPKKSLSKKSAASLRDEDEDETEINRSPSPPRAPIAIKRRRVLGLLDEEEEEEEEEVVTKSKRGPVRKLGDDFERVARESGMAPTIGVESGAAAALKTRSKSGKTNVSSDSDGVKKGKKKLVKGVGKIGAAVVAASAGIRSSPRFAKRR